MNEYNGTVSRRLYINPGITGLWQISGRSDLSWEESVNLDLRYVENWSLTSDLMIMWRTAKVIRLSRGPTDVGAQQHSSCGSALGPARNSRIVALCIVAGGIAIASGALTLRQQMPPRAPPRRMPLVSPPMRTP